MNSIEDPVWICLPCGTIYGNRAMGVATIHVDTCGVCGKYDYCTEPRDFGHLRKGWRDDYKELFKKGSTLGPS